MVKCSFCGNEISRGTGLIFVRKDGSALNFCSRTCEKNLIKLGRKPRTTRWTVEYARVKAVDLAAKSQHEKTQHDKAQVEKSPVEKSPIEKAAAKKN
jgi:large subunit ribosomal protein L24e